MVSKFLRPFEMNQAAVLQGATPFNTPHLQWFRDLRSRINTVAPQMAFSVKDFGAAGDGTTDDSDAVNAAIEAAQDAGGGIVFYPSSRYRFTNIPIVSGVSHVGVSCGAT